MQAPNRSMESVTSSFRPVPMTGVIYVMSEASRQGYRQGHEEWANFGQGQPEASALPGAPDRVEQIAVSETENEYAPVSGIWEMREAVANFYNQNYRKGMPSQYSAENVCIAPGGRAALTRIAAALGSINLGHFLPDYTAYEELLGTFRSFTPIPIMLKAENGYQFTTADLQNEIIGRGLGGLLLSNPCNPTGKLISGGPLREWVNTSRNLNCSLIIDEFYSHYIWDALDTSNHMVSSAAYVEDVDKDPVMLLDGMTKNWRYPGWRVSWIVGPKPLIKAAASTGSYLDGGASHPMQTASIPLLQQDSTQKETDAIQEVFLKKRKYLLEQLQRLGIPAEFNPQGAFYAWVSLKHLPEPWNDGMEFFRAALKEKVIVVPGQFFDIDPGGRRSLRHSRFRSNLRLSFGPSLEQVKRGVAGLERVLKNISGN